LLRTLVPTSLEVFDFADQGLVTGSRETTTVPTQALYLLNDAFIRRNALTIAESLVTQSGLDDRGRIERTYLALLGRLPSATEVERAQFYVADYQAQASELLAGEFAAIARREQEALAAKVRPADALQPENLSSPQKPAGQALAAAQQAAAQVVNPDEVEQVDVPISEDVVMPRDARTAAWASLVQALLGSGEFQFVR
jgi:hypothetical protein